jgi:hypothetical protein
VSWFHLKIVFFTINFVIHIKDLFTGLGFLFLYYHQGSKEEAVKNRDTVDSQPQKDLEQVKRILSLNDEEIVETDGTAAE